MLAAKLFGIVAAVLLILAFLSEQHPLSYLTIASLENLTNSLAWGRVPGHMVLITGFYARAWLALICATLAVAYIAVVRWAHRIPNQTASLVGFAIVTVGIVGDFTWNALTHRLPVPNNNVPLFLLYALLYNAVSIGVIISLINLAWSFVPRRAKER